MEFDFELRGTSDRHQPPIDIVAKYRYRHNLGLTQSSSIAICDLAAFDARPRPKDHQPFSLSPSLSVCVHVCARARCVCEFAGGG
jgi:hypothetical protein